MKHRSRRIVVLPTGEEDGLDRRQVVVRLGPLNNNDFI
jgi:hypothetical protein